MTIESIKTVIFSMALVLLLLNLILGKNKSNKNYHFLISSIIITSFLLLVITLKFHHTLRSQFNIPNTVSYVVIAVLFIYHFFRFKNTILGTSYIILIISAVLIGLGLVLDLFIDGKIISFSSSDFLEKILITIGVFFGFFYYYIYVNYSTKKK